MQLAQPKAVELRSLQHNLFSPPPPSIFFTPEDLENTDFGQGKKAQFVKILNKVAQKLSAEDQTIIQDKQNTKARGLFIQAVDNLQKSDWNSAGFFALGIFSAGFSAYMFTWGDLHGYVGGPVMLVNAVLSIALAIVYKRSSCTPLLEDVRQEIKKIETASMSEEEKDQARYNAVFKEKITDPSNSSQVAEFKQDYDQALKQLKQEKNNAVVSFLAALMGGFPLAGIGAGECFASHKIIGGAVLTAICVLTLLYSYCCFQKTNKEISAEDMVQQMDSQSKAGVTVGVRG